MECCVFNSSDGSNSLFVLTVCSGACATVLNATFKDQLTSNYHKH